MKTRPLGASGIEVSQIGVGAMQFGWSAWNGPDEEECVAIVDEAISQGATFIDTAPAYGSGRSEEILGRALEGRREQVVLCTKFGHWSDGVTDFSADRIEESVEQSLQRLRTDHLDVLLIHSPPSEFMDGSAVSHYRVLQRLQDAGVIRTYGVSGRADTSAEIAKIVETTGSKAIEIRFNALFQEPAARFEQAAKAGVGLIVKVPAGVRVVVGEVHRNVVVRRGTEPVVGGGHRPTRGAGRGVPVAAAGGREHRARRTESHPRPAGGVDRGPRYEVDRPAARQPCRRERRTPRRNA